MRATRCPTQAKRIPLASPGNVRIIDPSAGQTCDTGGTRTGGSEQPLQWNAAGPSGAPGAPGAPGAEGPPGDGLTITAQKVRSNAHPVGQVDLGTGGHALDFKILELNFASASAGGDAPGSVSVHDISITKKVDKASPAFFRACVKGSHYKQVTITMRKAGGGQDSSGKPFLTLTMTNVTISSYQLVPSSGGGTTPQETATLHFTKVEYGY